MTQTIYKYEFTSGILKAPRGQVMLVAQQGQRDLPTIWIKHETDPKAIVMGVYEIVPTGGVVEVDETHVGSAVCGIFVWHVFFKG